MSNPISRLLPSTSSSGSDTMSKLLPSVPDMDTQLQLAAKMIDKNTATHKVKDRGIRSGEFKTMLSIAGSAQLRFLLPRVLPDGRIQLIVETEAAWHLLHPLLHFLPDVVRGPIHQAGALPRGSLQVCKELIS